MSLHLMSKAAVLVLVATISLVFVTACDPGAEVTWVNDTDETLYIYLGDGEDDFDGPIAPHSRIDGAFTIIAVWEDVVVVRDDRGNVVLRKELTWDEFEAQDFTFVIRQEDIDPE